MMSVKNKILKKVSKLFPNISIKKGTSVYTGITDEDIDLMSIEDKKDKKSDIKNIYGKKVSRVTKKYNLIYPYNMYELVSVSKKDDGVYYTLSSLFNGNEIVVTKKQFENYFIAGDQSDRT